MVASTVILSVVKYLVNKRYKILRFALNDTTNEHIV